MKVIQQEKRPNEKHTVSERSLNIWPIVPETNISGINTATVVRVEAITERPTSDAPISAASFAG